MLKAYTKNMRLPLTPPLLQRQTLLRSLLASYLLLAPLALAQDKATPTEATATTETPSPSKAVAPTAAEPLPFKTRAARDSHHLSLSVEPEEVVWLQGLEEEFLGLYISDTTGQPEGAVLMLHAEGQSPSWPETLEPIRTTLPDIGWGTLSITLPLPDSKPIPPRPKDAPLPVAVIDDSESEEKPADDSKELKKSEEVFDSESGELTSSSELNAPTPSTDKSLPLSRPTYGKSNSPAELRATQRIAAAMSFLHKKGLFNVALLGDGAGAARAADYFGNLSGNPTATVGKKKFLKAFAAVIIINARNSVSQSDINLPKSLLDPTTPTLDIYFGTDLRDKAEAKRRKRVARRKNYENFIQVRLPELAVMSSEKENRLSRRVRGFLKKHAGGMKLKSASK